MTPEYYRKLSFFDRREINEHLDSLIRRENGEKETADGFEESSRDRDIGLEAARAASQKAFWEDEEDK